MQALPVGRGAVRREGAVGSAAARLRHHGRALRCDRAERLDATLVNMRFVKPLDAELVARLAATHAASSRSRKMSWPAAPAVRVAECLAAHGIERPCSTSALPDRFHRAWLARATAWRWPASTRAASSAPSRGYWPAHKPALALASARVTEGTQTSARCRSIPLSSSRPQTRNRRMRSRTSRAAPTRARSPINKVGIKDIFHPVRVSDRSGGDQHTVANFNMYVALPHDFKGTHMSRFVEMLHSTSARSPSTRSAQMLVEMTRAAGCRRPDTSR